MVKRLLCWMLVLLTSLSGCGNAESGDHTDDSHNSENTAQQAAQDGSDDSASRSESSMAVLLEADQETETVPVEGGQLRLAIENPETLLPWKVTDGAAGDMLMLIYSPLMNQKEDGTILPCLAASKEWSEDLTELEIQLRDDVTFHNGKALTAEDVVYSIRQLQSSQNVFSDAVANIVHVEATEEGKVLLRFAAPGRMNEEGLIFPIVPSGYNEDLVPMGTGPYAYAGAESMREMHLQRYAGYFGEQPYIPDVKVYFVREASAVEQSFETTRTNLIQMDYFSWGTYVNQKNLTVHTYESYEAVYLEFNTRGTFGKVFSNREKTVLAVDAVRVLRDAYWGKGEITETLIRPGSWYKEEATKNYGYDADKAADMVAVGSSKVRLLYDNQDPVLQSAAETIRQQLEAAGLTVVITHSGSYDIALRRSRMTLMDVAAAVDQQKLLAEAETNEEVKAAVMQLDALMNENLTVYNLFFLTQGTVTGYGVEGSMEPGDWNVYNGVQQLYIPYSSEGGAES